CLRRFLAASGSFHRLSESLAEPPPQRHINPPVEQQAARDEQRHEENSDPWCERLQIDVKHIGHETIGERVQPLVNRIDRVGRDANLPRQSLKPTVRFNLRAKQNEPWQNKQRNSQLDEGRHGQKQEDRQRSDQQYWRKLRQLPASVEAEKQHAKKEGVAYSEGTAQKIDPCGTESDHCSGIDNGEGQPDCRTYDHGNQHRGRLERPPEDRPYGIDKELKKDRPHDAVKWVEWAGGWQHRKRERQRRPKLGPCPRN